MAWVLIVVAGLFEVAMAYSLKLSDGFSSVPPSVAFVVFAVLSFGLLSLALKSLEVGTAYAVWTGIGALGSVAVGILIFREPATAARLFFTALLLAGIIGIKLTSGH